MLLAKMFKNTFQSGFLSILYSIGSKPLQIWDKKVSFFRFNFDMDTKQNGGHLGVDLDILVRSKDIFAKHTGPFVDGSLIFTYK